MMMSLPTIWKTLEKLKTKRKEKKMEVTSKIYNQVIMGIVSTRKLQKKM